MLKLNDVETIKTSSGPITGKISKREYDRRLAYNLAEAESREKVRTQYDTYLNIYPANKIGSSLFRFLVYCVIVPLEILGVILSLVGLNPSKELSDLGLKTVAYAIAIPLKILTLPVLGAESLWKKWKDKKDKK